MTSVKMQAGMGAVVIWLMIVLFFMILSQTLNLEIYFVLWLIGLLVIVELVDPPFSQPKSVRYVKYVGAAGIVVFGIIVMQKILEIIA